VKAAREGKWKMSGRNGREEREREEREREGDEGEERGTDGGNRKGDKKMEQDGMKWGREERKAAEGKCTGT